MATNTLEKPKQTNPRSDSNSINKGIQGAENHANQGGGLGHMGNQMQGKIPGGKALGGANDIRKGNVSQGAKTLAKEAVKELAKKAVEAAIANPEVSIPAGVIILIILFVIFFLVGGDASTDTATNPCTAAGTAGAPPDTLTVKNDGPQTAKVGDPLTYHIVVADTQQDQEIVITEHLPDGVSLAQQDIISNWHIMKVDPTQKTITWKASENLSPAGGQVANNAALPNGPPAASSSGVLSTTNFTIDLILTATADNTTLVTYTEANPTRNGQSTASVENTAFTTTGNSSGGTGVQTAGTGGCSGTGNSSGTSSEGFTPATKDNCGGKDKLLTSPLGNYGDADCSFNKDDLYTYLKVNDPQYADIWFLQVVPKECSYNPNAWAPPIGVQGTLDAGGAWGCFQMGSSFPPGIPPDPANQASYGKNDYTFTKTDNMVLDRGDVNWKLQAHNAIMYNRIRLHCSLTYWGSVTNLWNKFHC
ncbi:MAG: hypothetical protein ACREHC_05960 [Candidatus Levyibacteriota bacterium]